MAQPFWHPMKFWQVLLVFFVAQIVCNIALVPLRESLGWPIPTWVGGGLGGMVGVVVVQWMANKKR